MKKRFLSMALAVLMIAGCFATFTFASADDVKSVSNISQLTEALKAPGTATIKLTSNIECSHKMGSEGHSTIVVNGNKTLDLNGHTLGCKDESNAKNDGMKVNKSHWFTDCVYTTGQTKTFMKVAPGASLTIDSTAKTLGVVYFKGKIVGSMFGTYYDRAHFGGYTVRDVFEVCGTLTVNNGSIIAGNQDDHLVCNGVYLDEYQSIKVHFNDYGTEQIFGTPVVVNGGKVIINNGRLTGRGIEAKLKDNIDHVGDLTEVDTWIQVGKDELGSLANEYLGSDIGGYVGDAIGAQERENDIVTVTRREEVIDIKSGSVEINGGTFTAMHGANIFGGNPDGKVKIKAGRFEVTTDSRVRVIDDPYHDDERRYGTVIKGKVGEVGLKPEFLADINKAYVVHLGETYDTPESIKAKAADLKNGDPVVVVGEKAETPKNAEKPVVNVEFTVVEPERRLSETPGENKIYADQGYYSMFIYEGFNFKFNTLPLTAEQKASGYKIEKSYRVTNADPNAESINISNSMTGESTMMFHQSFRKPGWYKVGVYAKVVDKDGNVLGSTSYTYNIYAYKRYKDLTVTKMPTKTLYKVGEEIDTTGIALQMSYGDGTTQDVTQFTNQWKVAQEGGVKNGQTYYPIEFTSQINDDVIVKRVVNVPIKVSAPYSIAVTGGYAEADGKTKVTEAYSLGKVKLVPDAAPEGKEFAGWTYENDVYAAMVKEGEFYTFTMPDADVKVKAVYKDKAGAAATTPEATPEKPKNNPPAITIANKFKDVPAGSWYYDSVLTAVQLGLVNGKSETEYKPDDNLTYAEAAKLAACMHQLYTTGSITLQGGNPWYQPYVEYCQKNGILTKDYNYNDKATRAGYIEIFANALPAEALEEMNFVADNAIPDVAMSAPYAQAVYKLYRAGILTGDESHNCKPNDNIKRSEVAAILVRMMYDGARKSFTLGEQGAAAGAITIKKQPVQQTAVPGTAVTFTVEVSGGKAPYTYQWNIETGDANNPVGNIQGNASVVVIAPAENTSVTAYCVITDAAGNTATSEKAVCTGKQDPFKLRVENETGAELKVKDGDSCQIKVTAVGGRAPYSYKWEYTGTDGKWSEVAFAGGDQYTFTDGKNTNTLTIEPSVGGYSGDMKVRCTVTDIDGNTATSAETHVVAYK